MLLCRGSQHPYPPDEPLSACRATGWARIRIAFAERKPVLVPLASGHNSLMLLNVTMKAQNQVPEVQQEQDRVPKLAIGHMRLESSDVPATLRFFESAGCRLVVDRGAFGIIELRGGTHIVVREVEGAPQQPSFDLMVDDVAKTHREFVESGLQPTALDVGRIHTSFEIGAPGGVRLNFTSSHAVGPV